MDDLCARRILILQGHPDTTQPHFGHALADAYARGARRAGREVRQTEIAQLDFPWLRSQLEWESASVPPALVPAQDAIRWAEHIVLLFPLWLGDMPALLKAFLEQVARPGFAIGTAESGGMPEKLLRGRSARVIVTMGMPALLYRWYFRAHSVKALERNVLGFCGFAPIHRTLIGSVATLSTGQRSQWLARIESLGENGR